jgi:general secretion pathway protein D
VRRAQVYIEALVVEVTSDKASDFGVEWVGLSGNRGSDFRVGGVQSFASGTDNIINLAAAKQGGLATLAGQPPIGLTFGLFKNDNGQLGLGAVARLLENTSNANILSTPNMITLDNELATIKVGQNVPIITGSFTVGTGQAASPFQTVDRRDVGLVLKVRPQISEGGTIRLAIYHENSSLVPGTVNSPSGAITNVRAIESNVVADDGQVIVLGGLIDDTSSDGEQRVRGLADIPVLGNLFKFRTRTRTKNNLMVFLRPVVVRSKEATSAISLDRYEYIRAAGEAQQPEQSILLRTLGGPVAPSLIDGQPPIGGTLATVPPNPAPGVQPGQPQAPAGQTPAAHPGRSLDPAPTPAPAAPPTQR